MMIEEVPGVESAHLIPLKEIKAARARLAGSVVQTPLVRLNVDDAPAEIYLKLENLQPIGSFKLRGAGNAMLTAGRERLEDGVWTVSAGNMAQGVAWFARRMGAPCTVVVPEQTPTTKLEAITRLGASIVKLPAAQWFQIMRTHQHEGMRGFFIHPFSDPAVMAGNGTIGLEILDELPDADAVVIPWGGGGLAIGIGSAFRAVRPDARVYASEVDHAAPLAASLAAGQPQEITVTPSFVDAIGHPFILPEIWSYAEHLFDGALVVSQRQTADAVRLLIERNRIIAEGAGASSVAAALSGQAGSGKVVCVVSGGNIDSAKLVRILQGEVP